MLTQERLKELLHYCPETGVFTIVSCHPGKGAVGGVAGGVHGNGYITIGVNSEKHQAHRVAWLYMTGEWPDQEIDHVNHNRGDNRWCNLRSVPRIHNMQNKNMYSSNKSGITGVHERYGRWKAHIRVNNKRINLGTFDTKEQATSARRAAEINHGFHTNHGRTKKGAE